MAFVQGFNYSCGFRLSLQTTNMNERDAIHNQPAGIFIETANVHTDMDGQDPSSYSAICCSGCLL